MQVSTLICIIGSSFVAELVPGFSWISPDLRKSDKRLIAIARLNMYREFSTTEHKAPNPTVAVYKAFEQNSTLRQISSSNEKP